MRKLLGALVLVTLSGCDRTPPDAGRPHLNAQASQFEFRGLRCGMAEQDARNRLSELGLMSATERLGTSMFSYENGLVTISDDHRVSNFTVTHGGLNASELAPEAFFARVSDVFRVRLGSQSDAFCHTRAARNGAGEELTAVACDDPNADLVTVTCPGL